MLTALVAFEALERVRRIPRVFAAALVALPYLAAAYLAQEAFKEPIQALFLLSFALLLPTATNRPPRDPARHHRRRLHLRLQLPGPVLAGGTAITYALVVLIGGPVRTR